MNHFARPIKAAAKRILYCGAAVNWPRCSRPQRRGLILRYHSVVPGDQASPLYVHPSLAVPVDAFERQIAYLSEHYEVVSLDELLTRVHDGSRRSKPWVAITFDDGYRDNYLYAFPILHKYGAKCLFYLTVDCIGGSGILWTSALRYILLQTSRHHVHIDCLRKGFPLATAGERLKSFSDLKDVVVTTPRSEREEILKELAREADIELAALQETMLSWNEVRSMRQAGMSFGAHTMSHPSLPNIPMEEAREEMLTCKEVLAAQLGEPVRHFSYPNPGDRVNFNEPLKRILRDAGYRSATTSRYGMVEPGDDPFELKRKGIIRSLSDLPDFHFWIDREQLIERWSCLPGMNSLQPMFERGANG